jgi:hypothetical protein
LEKIAVGKWCVRTNLENGLSWRPGAFAAVSSWWPSAIFPPTPIYGKISFMGKSTTVKSKPERGRSVRGGTDPLNAARMSEPLIVEVDAWAATNETSRSDAVRRLIEIGLQAKST